MKKIEILYFEGCPNHKPAVDLAREVVRNLGLDAEIREVEVMGPEDAAKLRFLGSPSIRIDGVDVEPSARSRTDFGFACRTYDGEGLPRREMLVAALRGENHLAGDAVGVIGDDAHDYCATEDIGKVEDNTPGQTNRASLWAGGAVVAAVIASACCWLPLLLIGFGVSAGGAGVMFEKTRPIFLGLAALLLAFGFYYLYFRKEQCKPGSACETPNPKLKRFNRMMLWVAMAGALAFALFPSYVGVFLPESAGAVTDVTATASVLVPLDVEGMACAGCAVNLHNQLVKVAGVLDATVQFEEGRALVSVSSASPPSTESLLAAVEKAGYKGSLAKP